jgi:hypothetical protein
MRFHFLSTDLILHIPYPISHIPYPISHIPMARLYRRAFCQSRQGDSPQQLTKRSTSATASMFVDSIRSAVPIELGSSGQHLTPRGCASPAVAGTAGIEQLTRCWPGHVDRRAPDARAATGKNRAGQGRAWPSGGGHRRRRHLQEHRSPTNPAACTAIP